MSSTITCEAKTTLEAEGEQPRLLVGAPVLLGMSALVLAAGFLAGGAALTPVSITPTYAARLAAAPDGVAVKSLRGGTVASVEAGDGRVVRAGDLLVRLDPVVIAERAQSLRQEIDQVSRELARRRRDETIPLPSSEERSTSGADAGELAARVVSLEARLAEADLDLLHTEIRAEVDGRVTGLARLAPGAKVAAGARVATIEPADTRVTLEIAAPDAVRLPLADAAPTRALIYPLTIAAAPHGPLAAEIRPAAVQATSPGLVRITVDDPSGVLRHARRPGDTVAEVAFATSETRSAPSLLAALFARRSPLLRNPD